MIILVAVHLTAVVVGVAITWMAARLTTALIRRGYRPAGPVWLPVFVPGSQTGAALTALLWLLVTGHVPFVMSMCVVAFSFLTSGLLLWTYRRQILAALRDRNP